jgi:hypothetical protein
MNPKRNLSPHTVADIARSNVIIPPIVATTFITVGSLHQQTVIAISAVNNPPRITPKTNLRINTVMSVLSLICWSLWNLTTEIRRAANHPLENRRGLFPAALIDL